MQHESTSVKVKSTHYFETRDFDLAAKVEKLPDTALVGPHEVAALSGIAVSSIQKPTQRKSIGLEEPRVIGRQIKWPLKNIRSWLQMGWITAAPNPQQHTRGRPTKAVSVAALRNHHA